MPEKVVIEQLRRVLAHEPGLRLAVLFGSMARGTARPDSDMDVGILPADPGISLRDELALQARLSAAVGREVDLVRLDQCMPMLRFRAAREGVLLCESSSREWTRFQARAGIEHAEVGPRIAHAGELFRRRLATGSSASPGRSTASRPGEPREP